MAARFPSKVKTGCGRLMVLSEPFLVLAWPPRALSYGVGFLSSQSSSFFLLSSFFVIALVIIVVVCHRIPCRRCRFGDLAFLFLCVVLSSLSSLASVAPDLFIELLMRTFPSLYQAL